MSEEEGSDHAPMRQLEAFLLRVMEPPPRRRTDWEVAVDYHPDLLDINSRLSLLSNKLAAEFRAQCLHRGRTPPVSTGRMLGGSAHSPSRGAPSLASRSLAEVIARQVGAYAMCDPGGCNWNASKASV